MSSPGPGRPRIAGHADAQRARILDAAQKRFIEQGFHAATIADIAATAGMSAGLLYRYFQNKNAIVLAIIERDLEHRHNRIATLEPGMDYAAGLVQVFRDFQSAHDHGMHAALLLETSAEATRVPAIREAASDTDRETREAFAEWLGGSGDKRLAPRQAQAHALLLQIVVDGLAVRSAREPDLDSAKLRKALAPIVDLLT